jgi:hypothetical protein
MARVKVAYALEMFLRKNSVNAAADASWAEKPFCVVIPLARMVDASLRIRSKTRIS